MALNNLFGDIALESTSQAILTRLSSPLGLSVTSLPAVVYRQRITGLAASSTQAIVSQAVVDFPLRGILGNGTGDGFFTLYLDSVEWYSDYIYTTKRNVMLFLPNIEVVTGTLELKVTNQCLSTADYWGAILGEDNGP